MNKIKTNIMWDTDSLEGILLKVCFERNINDFIRRHPYGTIVNIGCGYRSLSFTEKNNSVTWYNLVLPEFTGSREPAGQEGRRIFAVSPGENGWCSQIEIRDQILLLAENVLAYYPELTVRKFLNRVHKFFPGGELLFDVISPAGVKLRNRLLKKLPCGSAHHFQWGLKDVEDILISNPSLRLLGKYRINSPEEGISTLDNLKLTMSRLLSTHYVLHMKIRYNYGNL